MAKRLRTYTTTSREAATLIGLQIQLGRKNKKYTETDLAERAGISRATLQKIEKGNLKCELGLVFEVATLVGVKLFNADSSLDISQHKEQLNNKLALLPASIRNRQQELDDDF